MQMMVKKKRQTVQKETADSTIGKPLHEKIQARAHEIYLARGAQSGLELDDWLQAEQEMMLKG